LLSAATTFFEIGVYSSLKKDLVAFIKSIRLFIEYQI
jgi:hypothetical protein